TASVLASALRKIGFDLALCGEGSSDFYSQQVGIQVGELLGVGAYNAVSRITPKGDGLLIERTLEREVEVLEIPLPAVLSVTTDINLPRIHQMKDILAAGKKPVNRLDLSDVGSTGESAVDVVSTLAPESVARKGIIVEGDSEDSIEAFVQNIRKEL
ncbi:MAG: hypothetical protein LBQ56_06205, partial [Synergistaceae bacterium]|nr:hypothetical protein [Synergistaceae bacterium]